MFFTNDYKPQPGGIAEYVFQIAKHFAEKGHEITVLAPKVEGFVNFDEDSSLQTYRYPEPSFLSIIIAFFYFLSFVIQEDIVYVYNATWFPCGFISVLLKPFFGYKIITAVHAREVVYAEETYGQKIKKLLRPIQIMVFNRMDEVFAVSSFTKDKLLESGVRPESVEVFNNGVDLVDFESEKEHKEIIEKYNLKEKSIILTVSRLVKRKGHDMVIKALPQVFEEIPDAIYLIAGTGPEQNQLKKLVSEKGLEDSVIFLDFVPNDEINKLYNTCDVFIMPSRVVGNSVEGFGIVFLEANACKKPVIGGDSGGIPDAIEDGETGVLVNPKDAVNISEALIRLLSNTDLAEEMGKKGYKRIKEKLTWDKVTTRMLEVIREKL